MILVDGPDGELKDSSGNVKIPNVTQSGEKFELKKDATSYKFEGLENSTVKNYSKAPIYTYTLILQDADGKELERRQVQSTPAPAEFEYETKDDGSTDTQDVWMTIIPVDNPEHNLAKGYAGTYSNACVARIKNSYGVYQCPQLYNNTATVSRLVADGTYLQSEEFAALKKQLKLESTEEIEWFSLYRDSFHLVLVGQIVKPAVEKAGYTEVTSYETSTALALKDETKAFRLGTKIYTKGYYEEGDGCEAVYEISNRAKYTFGSIKTATGQWCNIVPQNNYMNLLALGAGRCFQVTWEKYPEWRAYKAAKKEAENGYRGSIAAFCGGSRQICESRDLLFVRGAVGVLCRPRAGELKAFRRGQKFPSYPKYRRCSRPCSHRCRWFRRARPRSPDPPGSTRPRTPPGRGYPSPSYPDRRRSGGGSCTEGRWRGWNSWRGSGRILRIRGYCPHCR